MDWAGYYYIAGRMGLLDESTGIGIGQILPRATLLSEILT